jgi:hypothetical protein
MNKYMEKLPTNRVCRIRPALHRCQKNIDIVVLHNDLLFLLDPKLIEQQTTFNVNNRALLIRQQFQPAGSGI